MSVTNEGTQSPLSSDIHVESDKVHLSKVDEHEDVENLIANKQSSEVVDAVSDIQRNIDIKKGIGIEKSDDIQTDIDIQEKNKRIQGSQGKCAASKKQSGDQLATETESSNTQQNVDKAGPLRVGYNCAEIGHEVSENLTHPKRKCFHCRKRGHVRSQCPVRDAEAPANIGNKSEKSYDCRGSEHISADCLLRDDADNGESEVKCFVCKGVGHKDYECPTVEMQDYSECSSDDSNDERSDIKCFACNGIGHKSFVCPIQNNQKRSATNDMIDEGQMQHPLKKMLHERGEIFKQRACFICHTVGHNSAACPNKKPKASKICYSCRLPGHVIQECPQKNTKSHTLQDRSRSRSPLKGGQGPNWLSAQHNVNPDCVYLFVGNLPVNWFVVRVKQFLSDCSKSSALMQSLKYITILKENHKPKGECVMEFTSANACVMAMNALRGVDVEGKKIIAMPDTGAILAKGKNVNTKKDAGFRNNNIPKNQTNNAPVPPEPEKNETYGLSVKFLESLKIQPPLRSKIFVGNLGNEATESGLREMFSLAGLVISVMIKKYSDNKYMAKIEFDHPVEAVQAISMFNDRMYYDKKLHVKMDDRPHGNALPPGLSSIGPGLGPNEEPMRGVRHVVELEPIKDMLLQELSKIKSWKLNEQVENGNTNSQVPSQADHIAATLTNAYQNALTGMNNAFGMGQPLSGLGLLGQVPTLQGLVQPNIAYAASISDLQSQMTQNVTQNYMGMANQTNVPQNQMNVPQNQMNVPQSQMTSAQSLIAMPQNQMSALQNQLTVSPNPALAQNSMNVSQNQSSSLLSTMSTSQLINMSENLLGDSTKSQSSQEWSSRQKGDWSTSAPASSQLKEKKRYDDSVSSYSESSKYNKDSRRRDTSRRDSEEKNAMTSSDMLVFKNLPPSVTAKALKSKMREVGELRYVEITGEGRAIVRFNETQDAARCLELFDRSKVDGQTIFVNFF